MAYPAGVITRPVTFGPAFELEDGDVAGMTVSFKATRPGLLWRATGQPAVSVAITRNADDGVEQTISLPVTDQTGWGDGDGNEILPGDDGHVFLYAVSVVFTQNGRTIPGVQPRSKVVPIPQGDLSPLDLDDLIPMTSPGGTVVAVPDIWSAQIAAAEAAALEAAGALIDSASFVANEVESGPAAAVVSANIQRGVGAFADELYGVRYTAYGHSFGQVQSPANVWPGALYPARVRDLINADTSLYNNRTQSGATMTQIAATAASTWVDGNGGLVTLMGNQNSVGREHNNGDAQTVFKAAVRSFLNTMRGTTGYPPTVLIIKDVTCTTAGYARYTGFVPFATDADVAQYNVWLTEVAAEFPGGWVVLVDPMAKGWDPATMTCTDGQHPNERGMALIVEACTDALADATYRRGLHVGIVGTAPVPSPPTPVTLTAEAASGQVTLTAGGGSTATSWAIYQGTTPTGTPVLTTQSGVVTGLTNGTSYSFVAVATNATGSTVSPVVSAVPGNPAVVADTFNRADSSTTLGTTTTGAATWEVTNGVFGIDGNRAYRASGTGESIGLVESATANVDVSLRLAVGPPGSGGGGGVVFRATDANNCWVVDCTGSANAKLYKRTTGTYSQIADLGVVVSATDDVTRVVANGSSIKVYVNGTERASVTDAYLATATKHGIRFAGSVALTQTRLDDFRVAAA